MAPLRVVDPIGLYHVMSRGNFRATIFFDDHYAHYLELLARVSRRRDWQVLDWCLIPNHYHLLIQLTDNGLSAGMRELNGCFSRWSNLRTGRTRTGHVFRNRFGSVEISDDGHLFEVMRYIPNNPVKAGLVNSAEEWRWSGYRATIGVTRPYPFHKPAGGPGLLRREPCRGAEAVSTLRRWRTYPDRARPDRIKCDVTDMLRG
jgi:putative transposase